MCVCGEESSRDYQLFTVLHDITLHCTWLGMCELLQSEPVRPSVSPVLMSGGYDAYNSWV